MRGGGALAVCSALALPVTGMACFSALFLRAPTARVAAALFAANLLVAVVAAHPLSRCAEQ